MPVWFLVLLLVVVAVAVLLAVGMGWGRVRSGAGGGQNTTIIEDRRPTRERETTVVEREET